MTYSRFVSSILAGLALAGTVQASPLVSFFPRENLGQFLAEKFDLATIRSSFGPRRTPGLRTFADFGMRPSKATDDTLVFDTAGDWYYELKILSRRDINKDGIEDLEVCFIDRAMNGGTYHASSGLLVTRYSAEGYAVALRYRVGDDVCLDQAR